MVKIEADGEGQATDVVEIERPSDLADIADLGDRDTLCQPPRRLECCVAPRAASRTLRAGKPAA